VKVSTRIRSFIGFSTGLFFLIAILATLQANAAMTLMTIEDDIQVYSGPGERFRVLATLANKTEIKASNSIVTSQAGRFYRVVVKLGENQRAIGFIPVNAQIRVGGEDQDEDELSKYGAVSLISKAIQITFASYRDKQSAYSVGYMHYLSPGFYVKGNVGQWITPFTSGNFGGAEIGNDALLAGPVSGFVSYNLGIFMPSAANGIFDGSTAYNMMMNASLGIRYNLEGFASFAIAGTQAVIYNQNNSYVATGVQVSLEVGL
jgi:hypothetical protein